MNAEQIHKALEAHFTCCEKLLDIEAFAKVDIKKIIEKLRALRNISKAIKSHLIQCEEDYNEVKYSEKYATLADYIENTLTNILSNLEEVDDYYSE